ncbi:hypothetical protein [Tolypothrix sp. PCC 7601]|uniref:hypothetical protein n=1 Tax=Tolypothrix sp. PCC 7601 TaxID=1188 RepID=UPI0005EAB58E|nr:hypothetical protein [Tolypothrix sp. PCC 7601]EKF05453.1 alpha-acetolactate decarboxylase [Tolypothrix sp. PCC 7601]
MLITNKPLMQPENQLLGALPPDIYERLASVREGLGIGDWGLGTGEGVKEKGGRGKGEGKQEAGEKLLIPITHYQMTNDK